MTRPEFSRLVGCRWFDRLASKGRRRITGNSQLPTRSGDQVADRVFALSCDHLRRDRDRRPGMLEGVGEVVDGPLQ